MTTRGEELAARFEAANKDFIATLEAFTPEQWAKQVADTGWTVGVQAHHVAEDHKSLADLVAGIASGAAMPPLSTDALNALNAEHAQRAANVTKAETLALARTNGQAAARTIRSLDDQGLQRTITFQTPAGSQQMTAEAVTENVIIGHIGMHLPGIKDAATTK